MVFADDHIRLDVGETKTVDLPYSVRSKASYGTWSCDVNGILEYIGTTYDVKVKVLAYTSYTCHLKYTYSYREDGWSYTETYILSIDINKPSISLTINPAGGTVKKGEKVQIRCWDHNDAQIYYSLNGSTPSTSGYTLNGSNS